MSAIAFDARMMLSVGLVCLMIIGCQSKIAAVSDAQVELQMDPAQPVVGDSQLSIRLNDSNGMPLKGAVVRVEGNMNHAGMKPSFADLTENDPGQYSGTLDFTMGGDWFLLVTATTLEGRTIERKIDVPRVRVK